MEKIFKQIILLSISLVFKLNTLAQMPVDYIKKTEEWRKKRIENLKSENGWLNLVGLYWLDEGKNSFGSAKENKIIFPEGTIEKVAGYFVRTGNTVKLFLLNNVDVRANGKLFKEGVVFHPDSGNLYSFAYKNLRWTLIKRGDKIGIRLKDLKSPLLEKFKGIESFPVDSLWRITAILVKDSFQRTISVTNVLGQTSEQKSSGKLIFTIKNVQYTLDALEEGSELFIVFSDATSGNETYPSGRFLYAKNPLEGNEVVIDFNFAINPPCAFTDYATCPLPPKQNYLPVAITAGEKYVEH